MKAIVQFIAPLVPIKCDVIVPLDVPIKDLIPLFIKGASCISNQGYSTSGKEHICSDKYSSPLNVFLTLSDYGIENGDKLFLI